MADRYLVPRRLDDPELIGFWTIDEFAGILIPFAWGILSQHIFIGIGLAAGATRDEQVVLVPITAERITARAELSAPRRSGGIEVQLVAEYQGDELTGQRFLVRNLGQESLALGSEREGPAGALAFAYGRDALAPGEATSAFLVFAKGGLD